MVLICRLFNDAVSNAGIIQCPVILCQYFGILFLTFPVGNVIRTWARFSMVTEIRREIKDDLNGTPAWWGTPHFSRHMVEDLNEQFCDRWIGRGGPIELATAVTGPHSDRFAHVRLHEKYGIWMQCKQKTGTTSLNYWCWKTRVWPWCFS
jgi:hypothetical protein